MTEENIPLPKAEKRPKVLEIHNDQRIDHYYWLRDRENPEVIDYLNRENAYREHVMQETEALQDTIYNEIKGRIKEDDSSVPYLLDGYYYYTRYEKGAEYPLFCRKKGNLEAEEEVMLDVTEMAKGFEYYQVGSLHISPNNKLLAYSVDTLSRRLYTIYIKDLETGEILTDRINNTSGNVAWAKDNRTFFYTEKDLETLRSNRVKRHFLGEKTDETVFVEEDETFVCGVGLSKSRDFILIHSSATVSDEYRYLPADQANGDFVVFQPRERDLEFNIDHLGDSWYIRTNADNAPNFKLMQAKTGATQRENWIELIPHREDVLLEGLDLFQDFIALEERYNGLTRIALRFRNRFDEVKYVPMDEETYASGIGNNPEPNTKKLRFAYSSMVQPTSVREYDVKSGEVEILKEQEIIGGYDRTAYSSERIWATAPDGTKIPISLVRKKTSPIDGSAPLVLYGYGSYGYSLDASFSIARLSLLDRGFMYAIAHIRGGEEMGRHWYEQGKLLNKRNTFTDFIACGEHLVAEKYAHPQKMYAWGGSAGGLLVGAVANMRPDLFDGIVAEVPFVDVVTTMLDESIPLTTGEYDEWGNPNDKSYYDYMKSYSPYDNIKAQDYPAMLITTGLHDSQVQYWEPAKWIAKIREKRTNNKPLLLYCDMTTGHGGSSGRFAALKEVSLKQTFIIDLSRAINREL